MELAAFSDRGIGTRERLEDYAADRIVTTAGGLQLQVAMVCDGAGGGEAGELAARLTSRTIFEYLEISPETSVPKLLIRAVEQANKAVYSELHGTGTSTVSMAAVHLNDESQYGRLYIANVGNSRIYLMRGGRIVRLNIDHTLENEYVYAGQMSFEEAKQLDDPEYVTRAIGIGTQVSVDIGFYAERGKNFVNSRRAFRIGERGMELQEGDTVFAASDGLFPYVQDDEFLEYALDDDVERATRTLLKYASDRGPEDNIALSVLFVPSHARKMVTTGPRLSRSQRAGIGIFLLAVLLLIGFLGLQVANGENQRIAILSTQTLVQQMIIEASYTHTPTPLPPTATPTQAIIVGQVGNRFSPSQSDGLPVFTGRYIDPLQPDEINYLGIAGQAGLSQGNVNQANLYLQPGASIRLNQVDDTPGSEHIDMILGRGSDFFANAGDFAHGGISVGLEQNPDIVIQSQSACLSIKQISASATKQDDTDKAAVVCYGGGSCTYTFPGASPVSIAPEQQVLLDVDNHTVISTTPVDQQEVDTYRSTIWQLTHRQDQLNCLSKWLDEDQDGIAYPIDQCPADFGPSFSNGCPVQEDLDGDNLVGVNDRCPLDAGPASNQGCPTEGPVATQYVLTQTAAVQASPTPTATPTATEVPKPEAHDDRYSTMGDSPLDISAAGVLGNDTLNGASLVPFSGPSSKGGTVTLSADGSFVYTPPANFVGIDSFDYTLTGDTGDVTAHVTINVLKPPPEPPVAAFTVSPSSGNSPLTVIITDASTGPINSYDWDFGDGSAHSASSIPGSHTYKNTAAGTVTFTITLTVSGPGGTDTVSHDVTVSLAAPIACFSPVTSTVIVGGTVSFSASCSSGNITGYSWDFGDGSPVSTGQNVTHTYNATSAGFAVKLTVSGPGGSDTATGSVTVNPPPPQACLDIPNWSVASGASVTFTTGCSTNTAGGTFSWLFSDGGNVPNGPTATRVYTVDVTVTLTITVPGAGSSTTTGHVTITTVPTAPTGCSFAPLNSVPQTVNFTANCTGGPAITAYNWNFGDTANNTSTLAAPSHTFTKVGPFQVSLTVTGTGGAQTTVSQTVQIGAVPNPVADLYQMNMNGGTLTENAANGVLANDGIPNPDPSGTAITAHTNTNTASGVLNSFNNDGSFTFTPQVGFAGKATFTYTLSNAAGSAAPTTVTICVNPVAVNDAYGMTADTTLTLAAPGVLANDTVPTAGLTITYPATSTNGGTITPNGSTGGFTYTNPGFAGPQDTFTYTLSVAGCPIAPVTVTATVTINVRAADNPPAATADGYTTPFNQSLTVPAAGVLANDNDPDGDPMIALLIGGAATTQGGTVALNSNGSFVYTPAAGFSGADTFTYQASDGGLTSATTTVTITVSPNNPPTAVVDTYNTPQNTTLTVAAPGILTNDSDLDGNPLTAVLVTGVGGGNGTLNLNANGSFTYTPQNATFTGTVTFTYSANDGTVNSAPATVTIVVGGTNTPPVANNDGNYDTPINTPLNVPAAGVLANDTDADGNPLTAVLVTNAAFGLVTLNANGSFTYTPNPGFANNDSFTYQANDGNGGTSNIATVNIRVRFPPTALNDVYSTPFNTPLTVPAAGVLANDTSNGFIPLSAVQLSGSFFGGTVNLQADGTVNYTPPPNFVGQDFFYYVTQDNVGQFSNLAIVTINIGLGNLPPNATDDNFYTTPLNTPLDTAASGAPTVLANDTDPEGDALTALPTGNTTTQGGTVVLAGTGAFVYTPPNAAFAGTDTFTYQASDGLNVSNVATVTITVGGGGGGNTPPIAANDSYTVGVNKTLTITAVNGILKNDSDADGDPLTVDLATIVTTTHGTLTLQQDGSFVYVPNANYKGLDSFTYNAFDGTANSLVPATVTIAVGVSTVKPVIIQLPAPPPATACTDVNFENPGMIRSHFTNDIDRDQLFCRLIAAGGNYMYWYGSPLTNAGNVGAQNVLNLGLVAAVDVFSMRHATGFVGDVDICLKGSGYMIYMNADNAPREPQLWSSWTTDAFPGYTCTTLYAPGTVILVANKP